MKKWQLNVFNVLTKRYSSVWGTKTKRNYELQGDYKNHKREKNFYTLNLLATRVAIAKIFNKKKETCQAELPEGVNSMEQLWMKPVET